MSVEIDLTLPLPRFALRVEAKLPPGVTAILGPSGAGKTSLLESVAGLRRGATGRLVVGGEALLDSERGVSLPPERRRVGYVPQDSGLFPHLSVLGNVRFGARADRKAVDPEEFDERTGDQTRIRITQDQTDHGGRHNGSGN